MELNGGMQLHLIILRFRPDLVRLKSTERHEIVFSPDD